jgi:hypothetical protein
MRPGTRTSRSVHSSGENRWIEKIILIRSWNWVALHCVPDARCFQRPLDAHVGLVVGQRDSVDADDRYTDDVRDACPARRCVRFSVEVTSLSPVP